VRVAVAAGRPRVTHPALANVAITSVALDGAAAANAADDYTTALCALIAASGGGGFEGAAPGAELLSIGVLDEHYSATNANIASGIDRAVLGGARVLCLSLGGSTRSKVVADAIADAVEAGITVIAAAGNNGSAVPVYPAALESVIAVGAVGMNGEPTPWTSYGSWVDVMAPGNDLPLPAGDNGYSVMKGTSWSCAIVSGVVALLLQIDPTLKPAAVKQLLVDTAHTSHTGARVVNAQFAAWRTVWPSGKANPHPKAAAKTARRPPKKRRP
jgi:subtilisin family serine protease